MRKTKEETEFRLATLAEEALKRAVTKAISQYRLAGQSIVVWRDNKIVHIPADQIEINEAAAPYVTTGKKNI